MASYTFGPFQLDEEARLLLRDGQPVPLTGKVFDTLTVLVRNRGRVLSKEDLMAAVWPGTIVEEANLTQSVSVLRKALGDSAKDYQYIATVAGRGYSFIASVSAAPDTQVEAAPQERVKPDGLPARWIGAAVLIAASLAIGGWILVSANRTPKLPAPRIVPFTTNPGIEIMPKFSPDGNQIAYVQGEEGSSYTTLAYPNGGPTSIYTKLIGAGTELRVTSGNAIDLYPAWSPDGRYIAFQRATAETAGYYVVSALGGPVRHISNVTRSNCTGLTWTPDGKSLVVSEMSEEPTSIPLAMVSIESGERRIITAASVGQSTELSPAFSPDGRWLGFIRETPGKSSICVLPWAGGSSRCLLSDGEMKEGLAWTQDSREIIFDSGFPRSRLWRIALAGGTPVAMTPEDVSAHMPTISRDGHRLAYAVSSWTTSLWRVELPGDGRVGGTPQRTIASTRLQIDPDYSPDGSTVVFASDRSEKIQLWLAGQRGEHAMQITHMENTNAGSPRWSPDGTEIAFDTWLAEIWAVRSDGGPARRITNHAAADYVPSWSRDGRWIYFGSDRSGEFQVWKVSRAGESPSSPATQVTVGGGFRSAESFDGKYLYFAKGRGKPGLWRRTLGGASPATEEPVVPSLQHWGWWALSASGVYFIEERRKGTFLKCFDPALGTTRLIREIPGPIAITTPALAASSDGRQVLYVKGDTGNSDLALVENFR